MSDTLKVGWVISGNQEVASCRLQGFHIHDYLARQGVASKIVVTDFNSTHPGYSLPFLRLARQLRSDQVFDVILFERPNWMAFKLSQLCRMAGIKTIAIRCDLLPGAYDEHFDLTIVPTDQLAHALKISRFHAIEDLVEVPYDVYKHVYEQSSGKLKLVWVGHPGYRDFILGFCRSLEDCPALRDRIEIRTISRGPWATHQWSLETVFADLCAADIAILPIPEGERFAIKSANRLAMFMALGMPTVASPIASYARIACHGENCLIANTVEEYADQILALQSAATRQRIGDTARAFARANFAKDKIGAQWKQVIDDMSQRRAFAAIRPGFSARAIHVGLAAFRPRRPNVGGQERQRKESID